MDNLTFEELSNYAPKMDYIGHEPNPEYRDELTKALAIIRAIDKIGKGTVWLSETSKT